MSSIPKRSQPQCIRHRIETECDTEAEKEALARRLSRVRQLLSPNGRTVIDNGTLLNAIFDLVEKDFSWQLPSTAPVHEEVQGQSFMKDSSESWLAELKVIGLHIL